MRRCACVIAVAVDLAVLGLAGPAVSGESVSIGISTPSMSFGLNIGSPPPVAVVPGLPVSYAPSLPANYFVYGGYYYLFHEGTWFYAHQYNGPWFSLVIHQVPQPVLAVPVHYYRKPPGHWKKGGRPPWAEHGKEHGKDKGKHKHKKKGKDD